MIKKSIFENSPPFYARQSLTLPSLVKRSRGYYLYCADGRRIFDMYLGNGRLVYGHKPFQIAKKGKEAIDQGLLADLPNRYHRQLLQQCERIFEQYQYFYLFPSLPLFMHALRRQYTIRARSMNVVDPAYWWQRSTEARGASSHKSYFLAYYRVGLPIPKATILLPLLQTPHVNAVQLVCSKQRFELPWQMKYASAFDTIGMLEALRELHPEHMRRMYSSNRKDIIEPIKHQQHHRLECWRDNRYYLHTTLSRKEYGKLHETLLSHNILINPDHRGITLLPPQMPKKEYLKFVQISGSI